MKSNELKDQVVDWLIKKANEKGDVFDIDTSVLSKDLKCTPHEINRVIVFLSSKGFVKSEGFMGDNYCITVHQELYDLHDSGGFTRQYETLKLQFEQLKLEVEKLQNDDMEKMATKTTVMTNIIELGRKFITAAGLFVNNLH